MYQLSVDAYWTADTPSLGLTITLHQTWTCAHTQELMNLQVYMHGAAAQQYTALTPIAAAARPLPRHWTFQRHPDPPPHQHRRTLRAQALISVLPSPAERLTALRRLLSDLPDHQRPTLPEPPHWPSLQLFTHSPQSAAHLSSPRFARHVDKLGLPLMLPQGEVIGKYPAPGEADPLSRTILNALIAPDLPLLCPPWWPTLFSTANGVQQMLLITEELTRQHWQVITRLLEQTGSPDAALTAPLATGTRHRPLPHLTPELTQRCVTAAANITPHLHFSGAAHQRQAIYPDTPCTN